MAVAVRAERRRASLTCSARRRSRPIVSSTSSTSASRRAAVGDVVAGGVQVARVEADAEPRVAVRARRRARRARRASGRSCRRRRPSSPSGATCRRRSARGSSGAPRTTRSSPASNPAPRCEPTWKMTRVGLDRARDVDGRRTSSRPTSRRSRRSARRGCRGRARGRRRRRSRASRALRLNRSIASGLCAVGRHIRGLCVKTWTQSPPIASPRSIAVSIPPARGDVGADLHRATTIRTR